MKVEAYWHFNAQEAGPMTHYLIRWCLESASNGRTPMRGEATHQIGTEAQGFLQPRTHEDNVSRSI